MKFKDGILYANEKDEIIYEKEGEAPEMIAKDTNTIRCLAISAD